MWCGSTVERKTGLHARTSARRARWKATSFASDAKVFTMVFGVAVEPDV